MRRLVLGLAALALCGAIVPVATAGAHARAAAAGEDHPPTAGDRSPGARGGAGKLPLVRGHQPRRNAEQRGRADLARRRGRRIHRAEHRGHPRDRRPDPRAGRRHVVHRARRQPDRTRRPDRPPRRLHPADPGQPPDRDRRRPRRLPLGDAGRHRQSGQGRPARFGGGIGAQPGARPAAIALGPDSALWAVETETATLARIALQGTSSNYPLPTSGAIFEGAVNSDIATGPDGNLWLSQEDGPYVGEVIPTSTQPEYVRYEVPVEGRDDADRAGAAGRPLVRGRRRDRLDHLGRQERRRSGLPAGTLRRDDGARPKGRKASSGSPPAKRSAPTLRRRSSSSSTVPSRRPGRRSRCRSNVAAAPPAKVARAPSKSAAGRSPWPADASRSRR